MPYTFTISPDFNPQSLPAWYIFNTWLQKSLGEAIHLEWYNDFASQHQAIQADEIDLIYANPFDAAMLVREKGFQTIASPTGVSDEAMIVVSSESAIEEVESLTPGVRIASTDDPHVHLMCMMMLEPANLDKSNTQINLRDTYVLVGKDLLQGNADIGFFLEATFNDLSEMVRQKLRPIASSKIQLIRHVLMSGLGLAEKHAAIRDLIANMSADDKGQDIIKGLGFSGWEMQDQESTEFMIDLMDTLASD